MGIVDRARSISRSSRAERSLSHLGAGDLFGAAALFTDNQDYATTLTALTPCRLVLFPQDGVERLVEESSRFALNYIRYLSSRIQFLSGRLDTVSAGTAEGKLAQYLLSAVGDEEQPGQEQQRADNEKGQHRQFRHGKDLVPFQSVHVKKEPFQARRLLYHKRWAVSISPPGILGEREEIRPCLFRGFVVEF